jgi:glycosyltransferase involved in cell wall biosynthesis
MYNGNTVAAVVPAYNEEGLIGEVIRTLPPFVDRAYVIDDGSTDGTWAEIRENAVAVNSQARGEEASEDRDSRGDTGDRADRSENPPAVRAVTHEADSNASAESRAPGGSDGSGRVDPNRTARDGAPRDGTGTAHWSSPGSDRGDGPERAAGIPSSGTASASTNGRETTSGGAAPSLTGERSGADTGGDAGAGAEAGGAAVSQGSKSETGTAHLEPRVVPIKHGRNRGVGAALKTGYRRALADGIDVTAVIAGDGQTAADIVERIVAPVAAGDADYAKGNRLLAGDRDAMPRFRQVGNVTLSLLTKVASGYWSVLDSQNGSTAISHEALSALDIDEVYEGYGYCNDILVRLNARDMRVADVSRRAVYEDETSHISLGSYVPSLSRLLLGGFCWRLRRKYLIEDTHPLVGFYVLGVLLTVAGLGRAAARLRPGSDSRRAGRHGSGAGSLLGTGLFALLFAMAADREENKDLDFVVRHDGPDRGRDDNTTPDTGDGRSRRSGTD